MRRILVKKGNQLIKDVDNQHEFHYAGGEYVKIVWKLPQIRVIKIQWNESTDIIRLAAQSTLRFASRRDSEVRDDNEKWKASSLEGGGGDGWWRGGGGEGEEKGEGFIKGRQTDRQTDGRAPVAAALVSALSPPLRKRKPRCWFQGVALLERVALDRTVQTNQWIWKINQSESVKGGPWAYTQIYAYI